MSIFTDLFFPRYKGTESEHEQALRGAVETGLAGAFRIKTASEIAELARDKSPFRKFFRKEGENLELALKRAQLAREAQSIGIKPSEAMDDDFLDKYEDKPKLLESVLHHPRVLSKGSMLAVLLGKPSTKKSILSMFR